MSAGSHQAGFQRGREAALAGQPRPEPRKDLAYADPGYQQYWLSLADGHRQGERERRAQETAAA